MRSTSDLLSALAASPRPNGSESLARARRACAEQLRQSGFDIRELPFSYSQFPGRFGTPLIGAGAMGVVAVAGHWGARGATVIPIATIVIGAVILGAMAQWMTDRGVLTAPVSRATGINLEATPSRGAPAVWLCAHLDSKSQPIPTLARSAGIVTQIIGVTGTAALAIGALVGWTAPCAAWMVAALVTLAGSIPVVLSVVGDRSPGALDNASGVVTVLMAAQQLTAASGVGVLITEGEELGLAGARAWSAQRGGGAKAVLNCDGVDDDGAVVVMYSGVRPDELLHAVAEAAQSRGIAHRARPLVLGLLTDSVAFAGRGIPSITFSRGTLRTLARVHSRSDDLARLEGRGIAPTAALIEATARTLLRSER